MLIKSILIWLSIVPLAILNGELRERVIGPIIGEKYANPISGIILCILIFIISFLFIPRLGIGTNKTYIKIGILWVLLTIIFETVFSLFLGNKINEILNAYNITTGNLWLIVVIFIGFIPFLIAKIKNII
jgi:hypothetical protein